MPESRSQGYSHLKLMVYICKMATNFSFPHIKCGIISKIYTNAFTCILITIILFVKWNQILLTHKATGDQWAGQMTESFGIQPAQVRSSLCNNGLSRWCHCVPAWTTFPGGAHGLRLTSGGSHQWPLWRASLLKRHPTFSFVTQVKIKLKPTWFCSVMCFFSLKRK